MRDRLGAVSRVVAGIRTVLHLREVPADARSAEFKELVVAVRDHQDGRVLRQLLVDDRTDALDQVAVPGVRPAQVRLPADPPLLLEACLVGPEQLAVAAGRYERTERPSPKWWTNPSSAQTTRYPAARTRSE